LLLSFSEMSAKIRYLVQSS